jgi:3-phytase
MVIFYVRWRTGAFYLTRLPVANPSPRLALERHTPRDKVGAPSKSKEPVMRNPSLLVLVSLLTGTAVSAQPVQVAPTRQTQAQPATANTLRDVALWVAPDGGSDSLLLTSYADFNAGLVTFGPDGTRVDVDVDGASLAVAVIDGFPLGGENRTLVLSVLPNGVMAYRVTDQAADRVQRVGLVNFDTAVGFGANESLVLYRSPGSGRFYAFKAGARFIEQFELSGAGGGVTATRVRTVDTGSGTATVSGLAVDEESGSLFAMLAGVGLWRYGAEPDAGSDGRQVAAADGGPFLSTVGRLALYRVGGGEGYLIAADRERNAFVVFERRSQVVVGAFSVEANRDAGVLTGARRPLALAASSRPVGTGFPGGLFVAHNAQGTPENLLLAPWPAVADAFDPPLRGGTRQTDGGTDGGTDAGFDAGPPVAPPIDPPSSGGDSGGCSCATASVPASAVLALLALALAGRRRRD